MRLFLEAYLSRSARAPPSSVAFLLPGATRDLARELLWSLVLGAASADASSGPPGVLQMLASRDGALNLWALDVALTGVRVGGVPSAAVSLARIAESLLLLPPHVSAAAVASALPPLSALLSVGFCDVSQLHQTSPLSSSSSSSSVLPQLPFSGRRLPAVFSGLSPPPPEAPVGVVPAPSSLVGCICSRLLSVVGKLLADPATVKWMLSQEGSIDPLLRILALDYSGGRADPGLYTVHRQLVRTLGALLTTASQEVGAIVILAQRGVVECLVAVLRANLLAGSVRMEIVQMVVQVLGSTSRLCCGLVDSFRQCGGYDVLLSCFLDVERHGSPRERSLFVHAICHLLFVLPSPSDSRDIAGATEDVFCLQNQDGIKLLLSAFVQASREDLKTELLKAVQAVFIVQMDRSAQQSYQQDSVRQSANPFTALFVQFDDLSDTNKTRILSMLDEVVVLGKLSVVELRAYCALLQGKRPSTVLMICRHMTRALKQGTMTRSQLHDAGLLSILAAYLVPPSELPCASALVDPEEMRVSVSLMESDDEEAKAKAEAGADPVFRVMCHMSRSVIRLLCAFLANNEKSQSVLKDGPIFKSLYGLLCVPEVRVEVLKAITIVANSFYRTEHRIIQSLIAVLQSSGGTTVEDPAVVTMWTNVLESLQTILERNRDAAPAFRAGGGFAWSLSVIEGFCRSRTDESVAEEPPSVIPNESTCAFLLTVLRVLRAALKGCPENVAYLRNDIGFNAFATSLKGCLTFCMGSAAALVDILFSMAIRGPWPAAECKNAQQSSLFHCSECADALAIEIPEMVKILMTDLLDTITGSPLTVPLALSILEGVAGIVGASPMNMETMCRYDLQSKLLTHFGDALFDRMNRGDVVALRITELIVSLCSHNVTATQLRIMLTATARLGFPTEMLRFLGRIAERPRAPVYCVDLSSRSGVVGLSGKWLSDRPWPPRKFAASFWFCAPHAGGRSHTLFAFKSNSRSSYVALTLNDGTLRFHLSLPQRITESSSAQALSASPSGGPKLPGDVVFSEVRFEEGHWYHVAVSYDSLLEKKKASSSAPGRCVVSLFVNGAARAVAALSVCPQSASHVALQLGVDLSAGQPEYERTPGFRLSNAYFFEECIALQEAFLLYTLGPSFCGSLASLDFTYYASSIDASVCSPSEAVQKLLLSPGSCSLKALSDSTIAIFVARRASVVELQPVVQEQPVTPALVPGEQLPAYDVLSQPPPFTRASRGVREAINDVGGIAVVLYMMGVAKTKEQQRAAFRLLISLLRGSGHNCQRFEQASGYKVVARLLKNPRWELDAEMLDIVFSMVGVSRSPGSSAYDSGIVADTAALRGILLDWQIWSRAPQDVQFGLFQGLMSLVSINNASAFNVKRLSQCGAVGELLFILQRSTTPTEIVPVLISLIKSVMDDTQISRDDLQSIADFLYATYTPPVCFSYSLPGTTRKSLLSKKSTEDLGILRAHSAALTDPSKPVPASPASVALQSTASPPFSPLRGADVAPCPSVPLPADGIDPLLETASPRAIGIVPPSPSLRPGSPMYVPDANDEVTQKRSLVLEMLLGILSKAPHSTQAEFAEVFPVEAILSMMQHSALSLRTPLLLLLDICLQQGPSAPTAAAAPQPAAAGASLTSAPAAAPAASGAAYAKFLRLGGFALLGTQLQSYTASGELFHALFRLLVGPSFPRAAKMMDLHLTVHSAWEQAVSKGQTELARPEVIKTILMVAAGPLAELPEQHSVVKSLHHIYSSTVPAAQGLLANGLIQGLLDVLSSRVERRRKSEAEGPAAAPPTGAAEDPADSDEDIMSLLNTIALHPCPRFSCEKNASEMLLLVRAAGFPGDVAEVLQSRILHGLFNFFLDNPRFVRDGTLMHNLSEIVAVAVEYIRWSILPGSGSGHVLTAGSTAHARPAQSAGGSAGGLVHVARVPMESTVALLLRLLVTVLGSHNESGAKETLQQFGDSLSDSAWRLLLHIFTATGQYSQQLVVAALDTLSSKPLLSDPLEYRCCSLMIALSSLLSSDNPRLEQKARRVFDLLKRQTKRPSILSVVTTTLSTPMLWRMSAQTPVVDAAVRLHQKLGHAPPMELRCLSSTIVDEACRWEDEEHATATAFQLSQDRHLTAQQKVLAALRKTVREQRVNITQAVTSLQWRAQTKPAVERSDRVQQDATLATTAWKAIFRRLTHERAPFAIVLHSPYRRLKLDPTQDGQRQRKRVKWTISAPTTPTLSPPFTSPRLTGKGPEFTGLLLPVVQTTQQFSYMLICGSKAEYPEHKVDELPLIVELSPPNEEGTRGGTEVTVTGRFFVDSPTLMFLFGGIRADIVKVVSDTTAVIRSPPQPTWGVYEVNVVLDGQCRRGASVRYGYLEKERYAFYADAKSAMSLPDSPSVAAAPSLSASAVFGSPSLSPVAAPVRERSGSFAAAGGVLHHGEQIRFASRCTWISAFAEREGDLLLIDRGIFFYTSDAPGRRRTFSWTYEDICELHKRRYILQDVALELFFATGKTCLLAFGDNSVRDKVWREIKAMPLPNLHDYDTDDDLRSGFFISSSLTDKWVRGQVSNFEYLMRINIVAGRTFNDLNQYPVFPFLIADYKSDVLDLSNPASFRDLGKPMGVQDKARVPRFLEKYEQLVEMGEKPYHYGTHYSNGAIVTHFLSRLEPFASYHVVFQSGRFDVPDRLFFDVSATWNLASSSPLGDVKELTPEFFNLPEFLDNPNSFDFGERQDAARVFAVNLPAWAHGSAREFVQKHREALESEYVSAHLNEWIDLIFGCKQQDRDSINVFHPFTCEGGVDWDSIRDPMDRLAKQTQVNTWGQTPRQIFKRPHPRRNLRLVQQVASAPVFGGGFPVDSASLFTLPSAVGSLYSTPENSPVAVGPCKVHVGKNECLCWDNWDNTVRLCAVDTGKTLCSQETTDAGDSVTCASLSQTGHVFVCGTNNGAVLVWKRPDPQKGVLALPCVALYGHSATVRALNVCSDFSVIVTASDDCTCIVWDSNRLTYERSFEHDNPVVAVCVSPVTGDVFTIEQRSPSGKTDLHRWGINGDHIAIAHCDVRATCVQVTTGTPGVHRNVVATGNEDGSITLRDAGTLDVVGMLSGQHSSSITALCFSRDCLHLFSGDVRGQVADWGLRTTEQNQ